MSSSKIMGSTLGKMWTATNIQANCSDLRRRIRQVCPTADKVLTDVGVEDVELLSLTRQDLYELLPGTENFQVRRQIMEMITEAAQARRPDPSALVHTLRDMIGSHGLRDELTAGGLLKDYLHVLRDMQMQLTAALEFLKPHIDLLESLVEGPMKAENCTMGTGPSHMEKTPKSKNTPCPYSSQSQEPVSRGATACPAIAGDHQHTFSQHPSESNSVKVHIHVYGETLGAHKAVLARLPIQESSREDCRLILVFCPVVSRVGTDIEVALKDVPANKGVILIVMHHTFDQNYTTNPRIPQSSATIVQSVNILFHESRGGVFQCGANEQAITQLKTALSQYI